MSSGFIIQDTLEEELRLVRSFIKVLEQETRALSETRDIQPLLKSTEAKNTLAEQLAAASQARADCMVELGFQPDQAGFTALLDLYPELEEIVSVLMDTVKRASELNTANGALIATLQNHNKQAQDLIKALMAEETIYDEHGKATPTKGPAIDIRVG